MNCRKHFVAGWSYSVSPKSSPEDDLKPQLGLWDAVALIFGTVIGSAVFLIPSTIFAANPSPMAAMAVFVVGGLLSWLGALAYAELGGMFPRTGGEYVFLRESWGQLASFLCGWSHFLVIQSAGTAALAVGFSTLLASIIPMSPLAVRLAAPALLLILTILNYRGVRSGALTGNLFTLLKSAGLAVILIAVATQGQTTAIDWTWPSGWTWTQIAIAIVPVLWAYEGWNLVTFVSGEVRNASRNIPLALGTSLLIVTAIYTASIWVYLRALTVPEIIASKAVAPEAAMRVAGPVGGTFVTLTMLLAVIGSTNASVLAAPRLYYAQARDKLFFPSFAFLHPAYRTPSHGLVLQCIWASILSLSGSYELLLSSCIFVAWLFYGMCAAGVIVLRRKAPEAPRPYRMWGVPWTPALFSTTAAVVVIGSFWTRPLVSAAGLFLMLSGIPLFLHWRRRKMGQ